MRKSIIILLLALFLSQNTYAEDVPGSSDHPMVSRYEGSSIVDYDFREFDEYEILLGKVKRDPENPSDKTWKERSLGYPTISQRSALL